MTESTVMPADRVFRVVDAMDADALDTLLAEDARMVFGNGEPLVGRTAILAGCRAFADTISALRHRIVREWVVGMDTIAETAVTYTRLDGKQVTLPVVSIWRINDDGLIRDYRVFYDLTPVYAP